MKHVMQGACSVNGKPAKASVQVKPGDVIEIQFRNKSSESGSAEAGRYDEEGKSRGIVPVFVEKEKRKA